MKPNMRVPVLQLMKPFAAEEVEGAEEVDMEVGAVLLFQPMDDARDKVNMELLRVEVLLRFRQGIVLRHQPAPDIVLRPQGVLLSVVLPSVVLPSVVLLETAMEVLLLLR